MPRKRSRASSGSLAGWLFADLAIVLAIVFLQSSISTGQPPVVDPPPSTDDTSTTTVAEDLSPNFGSGISISPCEIYNFPIADFSQRENIVANLIEQTNESASTCKYVEEFGVVLVFAGAKDIGGIEAKKNARKLCEILLSEWRAVGQTTTYCQGYKNDDQFPSYFNLTLFPYIPKP